MGNKRRMSIRAEGSHVGTDPVSVRLSANSVYRPHNVFRPVVSGCGQTRGLSLHAGLPPELARVVIMNRSARVGILSFVLNLRRNPNIIIRDLYIYGMFRK